MQLIAERLIKLYNISSSSFKICVFGLSLFCIICAALTVGRYGSPSKFDDQELGSKQKKKKAYPLLLLGFF